LCSMAGCHLGPEKNTMVILKKAVLASKPIMGISLQMQCKDKAENSDMGKRDLLLALLLLVGLVCLSGCNLPNSNLPAFIAPAGMERSPTPNWAATLEAAIPSTQEPESTENPVLMNLKSMFPLLPPQLPSRQAQSFTMLKPGTPLRRSQCDLGCPQLK
jgi:hypothetical protein